jgi:oxygen-independent coproporphyrinogen-3 oxidase
MDKPLGLYLHFPFCAKKCAYCDFPSYAGEMALREPYTQALIREITVRGEELGKLAADTVSLMRPEQMAAVLTALRENFRFTKDAEISCEANPGTLSGRFLQTILEQRVNRLSLGAQSADGEELRRLGRIHSWEAVRETVALAREAGVHNISLDLMTGLPGQSWDRLRRTLDAAIALEPGHLSCYSLIIEEGTPFYRQQEGLDLPGEVTERGLYWHTVHYLAQAGFRQYEISNFARPGRECRHNLNCWKRAEYLGFGAAAAGFFKGQRRRNAPELRDYLAGAAPETEDVTAQDARFESLMLGLRMTEGLSLEEFRVMHGMTVREAWPEALRRHTDAGMMEERSGRLLLTRQGLDLMDRLLLDFLP